MLNLIISNGGQRMIKVERSIPKIKAYVKSVGQNFLGMRMADLLCRFSELEDKTLKNKLIQEYYENQIGTYDKTIQGTRTRVNAAIRIIRGEQVVYALHLIDGSDSRVLPDAAAKAKETLKKIEIKEILLPEWK